MLEMPVIGILLSRGFDARKLVAAGLMTLGLASMWMSGLNLGVSSGMVINPRNFQTLGAGLMFVPINMIAYAFIPKDQTNNASGLFSLVRNEGSSIGVALTNTLLQRRTQFHQFRLAEHVTRFDPRASHFLEGISGVFQVRGGDPALAHRQGLRMIYQIVQQQAAAMSYLDMFWLFSLLALAVIPLVFLMKRPTSTGGSLSAHCARVVGWVSAARPTFYWWVAPTASADPPYDAWSCAG
jgi:DHA2 family multidrug resistance protein